MLGFCPLASGSKGNSIYLGTNQCKILIDAGLSARATKRKLEEIGVDIEEIDAILISHEHTDHIQGLKMLALKMGIHVLANHETAKGIRNTLPACPNFKIFTTGETFEFGSLKIHPFSIQHDTPDPVGFTIRQGDLKLGFCTDLGFATTLVQHHLSACDYLYLEANHDPDLVMSSPRPPLYKQRVLGRTGHLSNQACGELLREVAHPNLKHVHLAHLSRECNTEERALSTIRSILSAEGLDLNLSIAPQDRISKPVHF